MGDEGHGGKGFSRRDLLKRAGMVGAVAAVPVGELALAEAGAPARKPAQARATAPVRESLEQTGSVCPRAWASIREGSTPMEMRVRFTSAAR